MAQEDQLRYPIGKESDQKEYEKPFDQQLKSQLINDLRILPESLEFAIQNLDEQQLQTPYRAGGWTVHQLVHHIADSHINAYVRFKLGLTENNPTIKPYEQDDWANLSDSKNLPVNISITLLHALHKRWCELLDNLTETEWQRTIFHPERKVELSLWDLLKSYAWHSRHHTAHILQLRERMGWN